MLKKTLLVTIFSFVLIFFSTQNTLALNPKSTCDPTDNKPNNGCATGDSCFPDKQISDLYYCQDNPFGEVFGKIQAPDPLKGLLAQDPSGAGGLSIFFSNLITLFYVISMVVLIFMIVWGAFDWITSEGDKEKVGGARNKIINAIIGVMLLAAAFGIIRVLGQFTGFKFFVGQ